MLVLVAATWVTAFLLVMAGGRKVVRPHPTSAALRSAGLPAHPRLVRLSGAGEVGLGAAVLFVGGAVPTMLLGALQCGFAVFSMRQRRAGSDCGCFGDGGTPVTGIHVWLNATLAALAFGASVVPGPPMASLLAGRPVTAAAVAVLVVTAAAGLRLLLTAVPDLAAAVDLLEPDGAT